ncbi:MAG: peptidylprolyl isomerase [Thermoguttaceae bacterium]|nr:peptidylprolyl isomerase [Thermoguttaceae bacterium]
MSFSSKISQAASVKSLFKKAREERRRRTLKESRRRRLFEALEERQMLDAASLLPEVITIADANSYHYAFEGKARDLVDEGTIEGLTPSFVEGSQVAFTIMKTSTNGATSSLGEVVIQLFSSADEAPNSSSRFIQLCLDDYYEGLTFHRIIPGFMFQGGSSDGYGFEGSDLGPIADEYSDVLTHSGRGMVAYANSGSNTSNAQFYVTFDSADWLDGGYNVFGYVVSGYDVIDAMEQAETHTIDHPTKTYRNAQGEIVPYPVQDYPVETYTITNMHMVGSADVANGALRIVANENASGKTKISFTSSLADDALKFQETTVYVGQEGLSRYVAEALAKTSFELVAGETVSASLPVKYGDYDIQYTITPATTPDGYSITSTDSSNANFSLVTTPAAGQFTTLTVKATLANGLTASVDQPVFISPSKPTVALQSSGDTKVGDLNDGVKIISSDLADSALDIAVSFAGLNPGAATEAPINVFIDGSEYAYTVKSHNYDSETKIDSYVLTLQLKDYQALDDGMHALSVREFIPIDRVTPYERLYSESVIFDVLVDTQPLSFVESETTIDINVGDWGALQLNTNKADEFGVERSDIAFSLANPEAGPRFISLSEDGVFSWDDVVTDDAGVYYVDVNATDTLGNVATATLTLNVGFVPIFNDVDPLSVTTGQTLDATISAYVPSAETVDMKYELVGEFKPSGMTINASTGNVTWDVPANYITNPNIQSSQTEIVVKATSQLKKADGTTVDGYSTLKTVPLTIVNSNFDTETGAPEWNAIADQTARPGSPFQVVVHATAEGASGVRYELTSAPSGMTVDSVSGAILWNVPSNYFSSDKIKSETLVVTAKATAIVGTDGGTVNYGASSTKSFNLTVENPDYVDYAPVFSELQDDETAPGELFEATITATDPNGLADRVALELVGNYPESFLFESGSISWSIPGDYLTTPIAYRVMNVKVKATEQYLQDDGTYENGLSSERTFEVYVRNDDFNPDHSVAPVWNSIAAQEVEAGQTFALTVVATAEGAIHTGGSGSGSEGSEDPDIGGDATQDDKEYPVAYELTSAPAGMTINAKTGAISWAVPANYFTENKESETITVGLKATTILAETAPTVDYGDSATTSFALTINNPNYVDLAPQFADLTPVTAATGTTYTATISAVDPEGEADKIVYALVGEDYPEEFTFNAETGAISWAIPSDYLANNVEAQTFSFKVKATEQYLQEDGTYENGLSTEKTFSLLVANSNYDVDESVDPVFDPIDAQNVVAGQTFALTVVAKASKEAEDGTTTEYPVEYSLLEGAPEGMTIDSATGAISWAVPEDFITSELVETQKLSITVMAKTVVDEGEGTTSYGGSETKSFELTVKNPNYNPERANWQEWFDAWVDAAQTRYDGHAGNLTEFLNSYLAAVNARKASLATAKAQYASGEKTLTEFIQEREKAVTDFDDAVAGAREVLVNKDALVDQEYFAKTESLNSAYDALSANTELTKPENIREKAEQAAERAVENTIERETGSSNFRFVNKNNGAKVATNLTNVLKLWREGYSYQTVYDEVYSDKLFTESLGD